MSLRKFHYSKWLDQLMGVVRKRTHTQGTDKQDKNWHELHACRNWNYTCIRDGRL